MTTPNDSPADQPHPAVAQNDAQVRATTRPTLSCGPDLPLGRLFATPAAANYMQRHGISPGALIGRHTYADPGELDAEDIAANAQARARGGRVLSAFAYGQPRETIWVITEADRSVTTLLLPADY